MTQNTQLSGRSVLVVEDDYYLATDAEKALTKAGASVVGPCGRSEEALRLLEVRRPDCAVVDINLGAGPSYAVAASLRASAVPFLFITGYDAGAIPPEFADIQRLEKPVNVLLMVRALARLCSETQPS
jgi:two-component SAPR family response regulator